MNALPLEIIVQILNHCDLPLVQLIRLRRVSKQLRFVIDEFMIDELIIFAKIHASSDLWTQSSRPLNSKNIVVVRSTKRLFDKNFNYVFRNLRRLFLAINSSKSSEFQIDLPKLRDCEIRRYRGEAGQFIDLNKSNLSLPKSAGCASFEIRSGCMESFHVNHLNNDIRLRCGELVWFSFDVCQKKFKPFLISKCIKVVRCLLFDKWIKKCTGLERLYVGLCWTRSGKLLRYFPRLKLLHIGNGHESFIRSIEKERQDLKSSCRVYYAGCADLDDGLLAYARSNLRTLTSDYLAACLAKGASKVTPHFPFAARFELDRRYLAVWREDRTFHLRFAASIRILQIQPHLLPQQTVAELIEQFKQTIYLQIDANTLSQTFYNCLPSVLPSLRSIEINNTHLQPELDLRFLLKFGQLYRAKLCRAVHLNLNDQLILHRINERRKKLKHDNFAYIMEKSFCRSMRDCF